ncbi:hypothetical protein TCAL_17000 [Tigriopus californicus]|uniref:Uncharacterized protein n=2 Tax=Tigriopus californicus TaxID=6832 RepID=A0A553PFL3_TIGCA|nr:hypothetical protein TCAL_17000 [Tigriopus californicus]
MADMKHNRSDNVIDHREEVIHSKSLPSISDQCHLSQPHADWLPRHTSFNTPEDSLPKHCKGTESGVGSASSCSSVRTSLSFPSNAMNPCYGSQQPWKANTLACSEKGRGSSGLSQKRPARAELRHLETNPFHPYYQLQEDYHHHPSDATRPTSGVSQHACSSSRLSSHFGSTVELKEPQNNGQGPNEISLLTSGSAAHKFHEALGLVDESKSGKACCSIPAYSNITTIATATAFAAPFSPSIVMTSSTTQRMSSSSITTLPSKTSLTSKHNEVASWGRHENSQNSSSPSVPDEELSSLLQNYYLDESSSLRPVSGSTHHHAPPHQQLIRPTEDNHSYSSSLSEDCPSGPGKNRSLNFENCQKRTSDNVITSHPHLVGTTAAFTNYPHFNQPKTTISKGSRETSSVVWTSELIPSLPACENRPQTIRDNQVSSDKQARSLEDGSHRHQQQHHRRPCLLPHPTDPSENAVVNEPTRALCSQPSITHLEVERLSLSQQSVLEVSPLSHVSIDSGYEGPTDSPFQRVSASPSTWPPGQHHQYVYLDPNDQGCEKVAQEHPDLLQTGEVMIPGSDEDMGSFLPEDPLPSFGEGSCQTEEDISDLVDQVLNSIGDVSSSISHETSHPTLADESGETTSGTNPHGSSGPEQIVCELNSRPCQADSNRIDIKAVGSPSYLSVRTSNTSLSTGKLGSPSPLEASSRITSPNLEAGNGTNFCCRPHQHQHHCHPYHRKVTG